MTGNAFYNPATSVAVPAAAVPANANPYANAQPPALPSAVPGAVPGVGAWPPRQPTAEEIWFQLGYYAEPTEADLLADLLGAYNSSLPNFLSNGGIGMLAHLMATMIDQRLVNFFQNCQILVMEGEGGLHLKPNPEQGTDEGKRLIGVTEASVGATITELGTHISQFAPMFATPENDVIVKHRQAATIAAQNSIAGIAGDLFGGDSGDPNEPSGIMKLLNLGGRAAGASVGVNIPPLGAVPPVNPPPGYGGY